MERKLLIVVIMALLLAGAVDVFEIGVPTSPAPSAPGGGFGTSEWHAAVDTAVQAHIDGLASTDPRVALSHRRDLELIGARALPLLEAALQDPRFTIHDPVDGIEGFGKPFVHLIWLLQEQRSAAAVRSLDPIIDGDDAVLSRLAFESAVSFMSEASIPYVRDALTSGDPFVAGQTITTLFRALEQRDAAPAFCDAIFDLLLPFMAADTVFRSWDTASVLFDLNETRAVEVLRHPDYLDLDHPLLGATLFQFAAAREPIPPDQLDSIMEHARPRWGQRHWEGVFAGALVLAATIRREEALESIERAKGADDARLSSLGHYVWLRVFDLPSPELLANRTPERLSPEAYRIAALYWFHDIVGRLGMGTYLRSNDGGDLVVAREAAQEAGLDGIVAQADAVAALFAPDGIAADRETRRAQLYLLPAPRREALDGEYLPEDLSTIEFECAMCRLIVHHRDVIQTTTDYDARRHRLAHDQLRADRPDD